MTAGPPDPLDYVPGEWCFTHNAHEPWKPDYFRECVECGHVYKTPGELIRVTLELWGEVIGLDKADAIYSCPHCTHDF